MDTRNFRKRTARENYSRTLVLRKALAMAVPCACIAVGLKQISKFKVVQQDPFMRSVALFHVLNNSAAYSGFSLVLGFLVVFRTQLAYNRFWEGVTAAHRMCSEWCDSSSSILAFTKVSKVSTQQKVEFERKYIKFLSLLHGIAVTCLRDFADGLALDESDLHGLSTESIKDLQESPYPTTVIFQWVQDIIVQAMEDHTISVPPPILSRVFNELANGMVAYHDCLKIQATNVPLPYKHMTRILMGAHWFITPVVMCMWTDWETWTFIFTLVQSMIFWCLYFTAHEIEFPFQAGEISYSVTELHQEFNNHLMAMARARTGRLAESFPESFNPENWVHQMKILNDHGGGNMASRSSCLRSTDAARAARSRAAVSDISQTPSSEGSVQIRMEAPSGPKTDGGETRINNPSASVEVASEAMAESRATIPECKATVPECKAPECKAIVLTENPRNKDAPSIGTTSSIPRRTPPSREGPSTGTSSTIPCRTDRGSQSGHETTSTKCIASEMSSSTNFVPRSL